MEKVLENVYDETVSPLMCEIIKVCKQHNIHMVASFQLDQHEDEEDNPLMCTTVLLHEGGDKKDKKLIKAANALKPNQKRMSTFTISTVGEDGTKKTEVITTVV